MKKSILILLLIISTFQFTTAQKINQITYKLKSVDSLSVVTDKLFSDEIIRTKSNIIFSKNNPNNIISIEDNINRRFDRINLNHTNYYSKLLNEGYFNLYELKVNDKPIYIISSKSDTLVLQKNDTVIDETTFSDRRYNNKLLFICQHYPELLKVAEKVNFKNKDLQSLISALNEKHGGVNMKRPVISKVDYLSLSLSGMIQQNKTDLMLGVLMSQYFLNISTNLSFKYGLVANYYHEISFFTDTSWLIRFPLMFNYEITNSTITPYFNLGLAPILYSQRLTRTYSNVIDQTSGIAITVFAAGGIKLKLTNSFNVLTEYGYDELKGLHLKVGMEYFLKL